MPNNESLSIPHNIQNIDYVVKLSGMMYNSSTEARIPLPSVIAQEDKKDQLTISSTNIYYASNANRSGFVGIAIVEYTKTTDQGDISL